MLTDTWTNDLPHWSTLLYPRDHQFSLFCDSDLFRHLETFEKNISESTKSHQPMKEKYNPAYYREMDGK